MMLTLLIKKLNVLLVFNVFIPGEKNTLQTAMSVVHKVHHTVDYWSYFYQNYRIENA